MSKPLTGRTIALPETRELDLFAEMLESRGAATLRCPLVSILDAPDAVPVVAWLQRFIKGEMDDVILFTGEGLRRLLGFAERAGLKQDFIRQLGLVRKVTRGPKPAKALRDVGLRSDLAAEQPTTDGLIATLAKLDLNGRRIGVQLYGSEPNLRFIDFLRTAGALPYPVAPYVYADQADAGKVVGLIEQLALGRIDVIAFTSAQQVTRLCEVAKTAQLEASLEKGLARTKVAAVGPIVADALRAIGARVDMMPDSSFFMKPLVNEMVAALAPQRAQD